MSITWMHIHYINLETIDPYYAPVKLTDHFSISHSATAHAHIMYENPPPNKRLIVFGPFGQPSNNFAYNLKSLFLSLNRIYCVPLDDALFLIYHRILTENYWPNGFNWLEANIDDINLIKLTALHNTFVWRAKIEREGMNSVRGNKVNDFHIAYYIKGIRMFSVIMSFRWKNIGVHLILIEHKRMAYDLLWLSMKNEIKRSNNFLNNFWFRKNRHFIWQWREIVWIFYLN